MCAAVRTGHTAQQTNQEQRKREGNDAFTVSYGLLRQFAIGGFGNLVDLLKPDYNITDIEMIFSFF